MFKDALNADPRDARSIVRELHSNWGHASAQQLRRILVDAHRASEPAPDVTGEAVTQCDMRQASDKAPRLLAAGATLVSATDENAQDGLPPLGNVIALRAMDLYSKQSP